MATDSIRYTLHSTLPGEPTVGVAPATVPPGKDQAVVLNADIAEWVAAQQIVGGRFIRLGVGPYPFTFQLGSAIIASYQVNEEGQGWYFVPIDKKLGTYRIANTTTGQQVWTAGAPNEPIRIQQVRVGDPAQVFRFTLDKD